MRKIFFVGFLTLFWTVLFTPTVWAQNKTKTTANLPIFMAGNNQTVDKDIDRDVMISGSQVRTASSIAGDAYIAGGQIDINGMIDGNLIVAGGNVTVSGKVSKNVIVAGGQVRIEETAEVGGYVLAGGGTVSLMGHFLGPVKVGAASLIVGEKAILEGNLEADVSKSEVALSSKINGEKKINIYETKQTERQVNQWRQLGFVKEIFSFLGKLLILLIVVKFFSQKIKEINFKNSILLTIGLGLVFLIVTPFLVFILMTTMVAIPLSLIILAIYLVSLYLSGIVVSILVGNFISKKGYLKTNNHYLQGLIGLLLLTLVGLIPFVGGLIKFVVLLLGLGVIFNSLQMCFSKK